MGLFGSKAAAARAATGSEGEAQPVRASVIQMKRQCHKIGRNC
jgi:hypothetical protein